MTDTPPTTVTLADSDPCPYWHGSVAGRLRLLAGRIAAYERRLAGFERLPVWRRWLSGGSITRLYYRERIMTDEFERFDLQNER